MFAAGKSEALKRLGESENFHHASASLTSIENRMGDSTSNAVSEMKEMEKRIANYKVTLAKSKMSMLNGTRKITDSKGKK